MIDSCMSDVEGLMDRLDGGGNASVLAATSCHEIGKYASQGSNGCTEVALLSLVR